MFGRLAIEQNQFQAMDKHQNVKPADVCVACHGVTAAASAAAHPETELAGEGTKLGIFLRRQKVMMTKQEGKLTEKYCLMRRPSTDLPSSFGK